MESTMISVGSTEVNEYIKKWAIVCEEDIQFSFLL